MTSHASKQDATGKVSELIKSNDQIYMELRKANEKYLNQRVENTKLKDEILVLQQQIDHLQNRSNNAMSPNTSGLQDGQRQQIRLKGR